MRIKLLWVLFLLASSFAFAQKQTGAIEGRLKDKEDRPIPGVTVTVSSPSFIAGSSNTFTDQSGFYRFPLLPPGTYDVQATLPGFDALVRRNVTLAVGFTQSVNFTLEMTRGYETIEVVGTPPLIDVTTTAVAFTVPRNVIENLPKADQIENLISLTQASATTLASTVVNG